VTSTSLTWLTSQYVQEERNDRDEIRQLVRELGESRGSRTATPEEIARLREFFGRSVLRAHVDPYILRKYDQHVVERLEWPADTTPEEYLESLRATVFDSRSSVYLTDRVGATDWAIYFVGPVYRDWRGPNSSNRIAVLFNAERHFLITGFQPPDEETYVEQQGGFWVYER
jgi:hypothetical protein